MKSELQDPLFFQITPASQPFTSNDIINFASGAQAIGNYVGPLIQVLAVTGQIFLHDTVGGPIYDLTSKIIMGFDRSNTLNPAASAGTDPVRIRVNEYFPPFWQRLSAGGVDFTFHFAGSDWPGLAPGAGGLSLKAYLTLWFYE